MRTKFLLFLFCFIGFKSFSQDLEQNIRGRVVDAQSEMPLPGVNVILLDTSKNVGTTTDMDGYYKLENVSVGRVSLQYSFIGYESAVVRNVELTSSKELVLNVSLRENAEQLDEAVVESQKDNQLTKNDMVTVSGRTFSIEESQRFAGSNNDVARMASNFAGVSRSNDANNDIVIRGNSPIGLIWRLEGVDIPNPNHFGGLGATAGPVSMLNNNVLANSDFLTGAFPAAFGDGVSGVFDLEMRNGNYEEYEFLGQVGFNGFEFGAEGPINRESKSSFLVNYRYSTLGVLSSIGVDFGTGTAVPQYQDISFKLNFPVRDKGVFKVFGMGGISDIEFLASESEDEIENFYTDGEDLRNSVRTGVLGASYSHFHNASTYSKVTLAYTGIGNFTDVDTLSFDRSLTPTYRSELVKREAQVHGFVNKKFDSKNVLRAGAFVTHKDFDLLDSTFVPADESFRVLRSFEGDDIFYQPYVNWQHRFSEKLEMNLGMHSMMMQESGNATLEPRFGMSYELDNRQSVNVGYGLHSQSPLPITVYQQVRTPDGSVARPNQNTDFVKSHHFVVGYDRMMAHRLHFKAEAYYQNIYDAVVESSPSSFSTLNAGGMVFSTPDSVSNAGRGYNYGLDLTFEKFMDRGLYFLTTLSLFESKYEGSDGVWRNTAFNGNYLVNLVGGKEFVISNDESEKRRSITTDLKVTYAGGQRYTPIDREESVQQGRTIYDTERAYSEQFDPYFRTDIRVGYKQSGKKVTQEWAVDIQNVTNHQNSFGLNYNPQTDQVDETYQLGIFPMMLYRITF